MKIQKVEIIQNIFNEEKIKAVHNVNRIENLPEELAPNLISKFLLNLGENLETQEKEELNKRFPPNFHYNMQNDDKEEDIKNPKEKKEKKESCIFCNEKINAGDGQKSFKLKEGEPIKLYFCCTRCMEEYDDWPKP